MQKVVNYLHLVVLIVFLPLTLLLAQSKATPLGSAILIIIIPVWILIHLELLLIQVLERAGNRLFNDSKIDMPPLLIVLCLCLAWMLFKDAMIILGGSFRSLSGVSLILWIYTILLFLTHFSCLVFILLRMKRSYLVAGYLLIAMSIFGLLQLLLPSYLAGKESVLMVLMTGVISSVIGIYLIRKKQTG